jgi:hypothetical protein
LWLQYASDDLKSAKILFSAFCHPVNPVNKKRRWPIPMPRTSTPFCAPWSKIGLIQAQCQRMILHEISNQLNQLNAPNQPVAFSAQTFQPTSFQAVDSINPTRINRENA